MTNVVCSKYLSSDGGGEALFENRSAYKKALYFLPGATCAFGGYVPCSDTIIGSLVPDGVSDSPRLLGQPARFR